MKNHKFVFFVTVGIISFVFSLIGLLSALGIADINFVSSWYLAVILYLCAISVCFAVCYNSPVFYAFAIITAGLFLYISITQRLNYGYDRLFGIVILCIGLGFLLNAYLNRNTYFWLRSGIFFTVSGIILLVAGITKLWAITISAGAIVLSVLIVIDALLRYFIKKPDDDYYVVPSEKENQENNKDKR